MKNNIIVIKKKFDKSDYEFVERKGAGHPDTLADALAEKLSVEYSKYTYKKFGAILHHNFDKLGLLGGASFVSFKKGYMTKPIRVLINGRISTKFGDETILYKDLIIKWVENFFSEKLPIVNVKKDLEYHFNISNQSSPGKTDEKESKNGTRRYWFEPRGLFDLQELKKLVSNDTSIGVAHSPDTKLEKLILDIENFFNAPNYKLKNKWIGSDIKILGFRNKNKYYITMCIPQIAKYVKNIHEYEENLKKAKKTVFKIAKQNLIDKLDLSINTRDNYKTCELYLTATGSSIESGDEGLVGRGNRINGYISINKPMSMEGACGKNPVYHIGKLYYVAAIEISKKINKLFKITNEVYLASQSGRELIDPWLAVIVLPEHFKFEKEVYDLVLKELIKIPEITKKLLAQKIKLF
jgi:S-adenosylmethionine synthetase